MYEMLFERSLKSRQESGKYASLKLDVTLQRYIVSNIHISILVLAI